MTLHFYEAQTARRIMVQVIDRIPYGSYVVLSIGQLEGHAGQEFTAEYLARLARAKADIAAGQKAVDEKTEQTAGHTRSQWKSMKADADAKVQGMRDRADRKRDEHDVKKAERDAEAAEEDQPMPWILPPGPSSRPN